MQQTEEIKPVNFFSRLGGVYTSPGATFKEIGGSPRVLVPIIALVIISMIAGFVLSLKVDLGSLMTQGAEQAVATGRMTQQQMEQQMAIMSKLGPIILTIGSAFQTLFLTLIIAAVFKLISVLIGAQNQFKGVFSVTTFVMIAILVVQSIVFIAILFSKNPAELDATSLNSLVASNLGALWTGIFGEDSLPKFLMKLFGWVDIFAIWAIALLSIGYAAVSRKLKTSTAATWIVSIYGIIAIIGSLIASRR
jgi:hypothetical protein